MRIITGKHKGRKLLDSSKLRGLRPTTDSNRENLFNIIFSASFLQDIEFDFSKCHLLDLFSGSGAVSFEALSRGVKSATLIDKNYEHIELSKKNAEILGEAKNCQFITFDLTKPLFKSDRQYDLIFIDPPYNHGLINKALESLINGNFLKKNSLIIIERSFGEEIDPELLKTLPLLGEKKYSHTVFTFLRSQTPS